MSNYARSYVAEGPVSRGAAVVRGTGENQVALPGVGGAGDFLGIHDALRNTRDAVGGEHVGVTPGGLAKALVGGTATAGKRAVIVEATGALQNVPVAVGTYETVGVFLEDGAAGELVDVWVERGQVTV